MRALLARVRFPHPLVLFSGAVFLAAAASWVLPTGEYDRTLDEATGRTVVMNRLGERTILVIPIVALLFASGGALENMQEEIIALLPVLLILTNRLGWWPRPSGSWCGGSSRRAGDSQPHVGALLRHGHRGQEPGGWIRFGLRMKITTGPPKG